MRRLTRLAAAMVVALGTMLGAPVVRTGPAYADPLNTWLTCEGLPPTTGVVTDYVPFSYDEAEHAWRSFITGSVHPCRTPSANHVLAVASYRSDGTVPGRAMHYPPSHDIYGYVKVNVGAEAVCLVSSVKDRLDCIKIEWVPQDPGPPLPVAGPHVPVDSPTVAFDAKVDLDHVYDIDPGCPTCVDD